RWGRVYRLPSEAEWEYSCRGGAPSYQVFHFGNSLSLKQANFTGQSPTDRGPCLGRTGKVGSYAANRFGLYDMHGNIEEWCQDRYVEDYYRRRITRKAPPGPSEGSFRVIRGGGWNAFGGYCRSASRHWNSPAFRSHFVGFRVALVSSG